MKNFFQAETRKSEYCFENAGTAFSEYTGKTGCSLREGYGEGVVSRGMINTPIIPLIKMMRTPISKSCPEGKLIETRGFDPSV